MPVERNKTDFAIYNDRNIYTRITAKSGIFLSIDALDFKSKSTGEAKPCMKIRCAQYDNNRASGSKETAEISTYIPLPKFLRFCHETLMGVYVKRKKDEVSGQRAYFTHYGGETHKPVVSRQLSLVDGLGNASFAFLATEGPGIMTAEGGITPEKGAPPTKSIFINMGDDELKEFCLIGKAYAEQFVNIDLQRRLMSVRQMRDNYTACLKGDI